MITTRGICRTPSVGAATGLIGLYFLLQAGLGEFAALMLALFNSLSHHQMLIGMPKIDTATLSIIIALPLAASIELSLIRLLWPQAWSLHKPPGLGVCQARVTHFYLTAIILGLTLPILGGWITEYLANGHAVPQHIAQLSYSATSTLRVLLALIVVILVPLVEEILFRGVLLSALLKHLPLGVAVAICALLFSTVHLPVLGFKWYALPDLILLALVLCWLRLKSGSIWPAVLTHSTNNLVALLLLTITQQHI